MEIQLTFAGLAMVQRWSSDVSSVFSQYSCARLPCAGLRQHASYTQQSMQCISDKFKHYPRNAAPTTAPKLGLRIATAMAFFQSGKRIIQDCDIIYNTTGFTLNSYALLLLIKEYIKLSLQKLFKCFHIHKLFCV